MKKLLVVLLVLIMLVLSACGSNVQSIDLSRITFDDVSIGDNFDQIETDKYITKTNLSTQYTYNYEEWRISVDQSVITEIMASFGQINISVNGKEDCRVADDIIDTLGEDYNSSWYDKEQSLMQLQYFDKENRLQCSFVYDKNSNRLVWVIMQTT